MSNKLIIISGMSGSGKTFLISKALRAIDRLSIVTAVTTRKARENEQNLISAKKSISEREFFNLKADGKLCCINNLYGDFYAFNQEEIERNLRDKAVILEYKASMINDIKVMYDNSYAVYIYADLKQIEQKMNRRKDDIRRIKEDSIERDYILGNSLTVSCIDKLFENRYDSESEERFIQCINNALNGR